MTETPIGTDRYGRDMFACGPCGAPHNVTAAWCASMTAELSRAAGTADTKRRKIGGNVATGASTPATGLMDRHVEPITLRVAEGRSAPVAPVIPPTDAQMDFIRKLLVGRAVPADVANAVAFWMTNGNGPATKREASDWITRLKEFGFKPREAAPVVDLPDVPKGSYAIRGSEAATNDIMFVRVWWSPDHTKVRVYQQVSDSSVPMNRAQTPGILKRIMDAGVKESMALYGRELGECGHCHRKLTSKWRTRGIGPVCVTKMGW